MFFFYFKWYQVITNDTDSFIENPINYCSRCIYKLSLNKKKNQKKNPRKQEIINSVYRILLISAMATFLDTFFFKQKSILFTTCNFDF